MSAPLPNGWLLTDRGAMFTVLELLRRTTRKAGAAQRPQPPVGGSTSRILVVTRPHRTAYAGVRGALDGLLPAECRDRLWDSAWELGVTARSLLCWQACFGTETAALAVAAGLSEDDLCYHLDGGPAPEPAALEMLADLNCFPFVAPSFRPARPSLVGAAAGAR